MSAGTRNDSDLLERDGLGEAIRPRRSRRTTTKDTKDTKEKHHFCGFAIRYSFDCVRMRTLPRTTAGVASDISLSEFLPSSLNSGPAATTNVSPSSLSRKILPLYAHGDDVKPAASAEIRCRP